jgi:hypothetical protein
MKMNHIHYVQTIMSAEQPTTINANIGGRFVSQAIVGHLRRLWTAIGVREGRTYYAHGKSKAEARRKLESYQ